MAENYTIEVQSSGYPILVAVLMMIAILAGTVGCLVIQDFVIGEIIQFDKLMWIALFTMAAVVIFSLRPAIVAYFSRVELSLGGTVRIVGKGLIYKLPLSEAISARASSFVLRRVFGRTTSDTGEVYEIDKIDTHQSAIARRFRYGTLILISSEWAICIDFVSDVDRLASEIGRRVGVANASS